MAISKIKLGTGDPLSLRDSASMHYVGHGTDATEMSESRGVYTSSTTLTGITATIVKNDYITLGADRANYVCTDVTGTTATWALLSEAAAEIPVQDVKIGTTSIVSNHIATIPAATSSSAANATFGVVETGDNITNTNGVISVADASTEAKGVVTLSTAIPASDADNTTVPTTLAVKNAIDALPEPMVFKGTVGTDGTVDWTAAEPGDPVLPSASAETVGYTYKVITKHTTTPICEVGDTIICADPQGDGTYEWVVVPSGDEPSGTVTSVSGAAGSNSNLTVSVVDATGSTEDITTSGTITVGVEDGYAIPETSDITSWNNTATEVASYTTDNSVMTGVAVAGSQGTGGVLVMAQDATDAEQLNVLYVNPTTVSTAVFKSV